MCINAKSKEIDFMEGQTLFEGSDQDQPAVKRRKLNSFDQRRLSPPTNGKTLRDFVKGCRGNCLIQNDLKQPEADYFYAGMS